jgi:hypothetical protein
MATIGHGIALQQDRDLDDWWCQRQTDSVVDKEGRKNA